MPWMIRMTVLAALAVLMVAPASAQIGADAQPTDVGMFAPGVASLQGNTTRTDEDPNNRCFTAVPQTKFFTGQEATFNTYWQDSVSGTTVYNLSVAVITPGGLFPLITDAPCNFGPLDPGTYNFCCSIAVDVPGINPPPLQWGSRVVAVSGGSGQAQGILNTVDVN